MEQGFIDVLQKLVDEQGNGALTDARKCKAFINDYTRGEYKKESRFIVQAVEAGVPKAIEGANDLATCKKAQTRKLEEEFGLSPTVAADIVDTLALVLRGKTTATPVTAPAGTKDGMSAPAPQQELPAADVSTTSKSVRINALLFAAVALVGILLVIYMFSAPWLSEGIMFTSMGFMLILGIITSVLIIREGKEKTSVWYKAFPIAGLIFFLYIGLLFVLGRLFSVVTDAFIYLFIILLLSWIVIAIILFIKECWNYLKN